MTNDTTMVKAIEVSFNFTNIFTETTVITLIKKSFNLPIISLEAQKVATEAVESDRKHLINLTKQLLQNNKNKRLSENERIELERKRDEEVVKLQSPVFTLTNNHNTLTIEERKELKRKRDEEVVKLRKKANELRKKANELRKNG